MKPRKQTRRQAFSQMQKKNETGLHLKISAAEVTFRALAKRGNPKRTIELLDRLDREDREAGVARTSP